MKSRAAVVPAYLRQRIKAPKQRARRWSRLQTNGTNDRLRGSYNAPSLCLRLPAWSSAATCELVPFELQTGALQCIYLSPRLECLVKQESCVFIFGQTVLYGCPVVIPCFGKVSLEPCCLVLFLQHLLSSVCLTSDPLHVQDKC